MRSAVSGGGLRRERTSGGWRLAKRRRECYVLIAPYFLLFGLFTVLPVAVSLGFSFTQYNLLQPPRFAFLDNYIRLFLEDDIFIIALKNTILFAVITGPLSYIACFLFAWMLNDLSRFFRSFMTVVFYAPSLAGNAYFIWKLIFSGDRYGYANALLLAFGLIPAEIDWFRNAASIMPLLIVVQLWLSLGTGFLVFIAGLQTVDKGLYEAGAIDGVSNRWQELWHITLPAMKSQLLLGAVLQITQSFAVADISINLAGFPSVNYMGTTLVTHLMDYGSVRFDMGYACAIATFLFALMIGTNRLVQRALRKVG